MSDIPRRIEAQPPAPQQQQSAPKIPSLSLRPGIEEETGLLNHAIDWAHSAAGGVLSGSFKPSEANALLGAGRLVSSVAKQSISNRVGRGRLIAQEAKIVEQSAPAT